VLQQNLESFDACQAQIARCDMTIEGHLRTLTAPVPAPSAPLPASRSRRKTPKNNDLPFDVRTPLFHLTGGVDLTQIDAIGPHTALKLISEIGTDMTRWPTEKHFTSWLTLAPHNKITGGRVISSRTQPSANRAASTLRMAARLDKPQAITATARKLAILVYHALKGDLVYRDPGADHYNAQQRSRVLRRLRQRAANLGFELVNSITGEVLAAGVS